MGVHGTAMETHGREMFSNATEPNCKELRRLATAEQC